MSIGAACNLSWPADRLVIQVLDDSTDPAIKVFIIIFFSTFFSLIFILCKIITIIIILVLGLCLIGV